MRVITSTTDLAHACEELATGPYVTVDTEFMRETTYWPILCLIQMAGPGRNGGPGLEIIVDPKAPGLDLAPFFALMMDERVVKVFHAARQDIEIIYVETGKVPRPVFDTQIAAMVCGCNESISYVNLVKRYTGADLDKSSRFTDWSRRPLTQAQLVYALGDVTHLRNVYEKMSAEMATSGRTAWVDEEMAELMTAATYESSPENAWQRLKHKVRGRKPLAVLIEIAAWRERLAQATNVPRGRVLRDDALLDIANQYPVTVEKLGELRSMSDGFARSQRAREIVEAVKAGLARDPATLPEVEHSDPMAAEANALVELLKVMLKASAARERIAPRLIADNGDLEAIATKSAAGVRALEGWRRTVFGEDALRLKRGELAITIRGGEVVAIPAASAAPTVAPVSEIETV
ncbi:MAG: ribonuclease D [Hyphomicrobiaceae bacterium]|nr:ribonuclease D [Hyphomicrobiaceae bacterium]